MHKHCNAALVLGLLMGLLLGPVSVWSEETVSTDTQSNPSLETVSPAQPLTQEKPPVPARNARLEDLVALESLLFMEIPAVSIASAKSESIEEAPANVYVISGDEMALRGYRTLYDLVEDLPGTFLHHQVGDENNGPMIVRGIKDANNIKVLMNGMQINPKQGYGYTWAENVPIEDIERVEYILGPYAALYGRNSFSGVLNIVTKKGKDIHGVQLYAMYGSWSRMQGTLVAGGQMEGFDVALHHFQNYNASGRDLGVEYPDIYSKEAREGVVHPWNGSIISFDNMPSSWKMPYNIYDSLLRVAHECGLSLDAHYQRNYQPKLGTAQNPLTYIQQDGGAIMDTFQGDVRLQFEKTVTKTIHSVTSIGFEQYAYVGKNVYNYTGSLVNTVGEKWYGEETQATNVSQNLRLNLTDNNDLLAIFQWDKLQYKWLKSGSGNMLPPAPVAKWSYGDTDVSEWDYINFSLQDDWSITKELNIVIGAMYETSDLYKNVIVPRAAVMYKISEQATLKALYGGGFKTPATAIFPDQFLGGTSSVPSDVKGASPETIKPESLDSVDLTFSYLFNKSTRMTASVFYNNLKNMIQMVYDDNLGGTFAQTWKNIGKTTSMGGELSGEVGITDFSKLFISYGYAKGQFDSVAGDGTITVTTGVPLTAEHHVKAGINCLVWDDKINIFVHDFYVGARYGYTEKIGEPGYNVVNLAVTTTKNFSQTWSLAVGINNLLNQEGFDPMTYNDDYVVRSPIEKRTWNVKVGYQF